ncbi:MAG TPA: hypothetical protein VG479_10445 [Gaiellaceae bacterium]|jgi:hypothetical protein|nr:hypothetical protein [Gaiellaceae bacterium]
MPWVARAEPGRRTRVTSWRALLRNEETGASVEVHTLEWATRIADLLTAADEGHPPARVDSGTPFRRYECVTDRHARARRVVRIEGNYVHPVARTGDSALADRIVDLLNRVDPAVPKRMRGFGIRWWG